ncbi:hypothetical protein KI387_025308, partial [Taxus chinensis]
VNFEHEHEGSLPHKFDKEDDPLDGEEIPQKPILKLSQKLENLGSSSRNLHKDKLKMKSGEFHFDPYDDTNFKVAK